MYEDVFKEVITL